MPLVLSLPQWPFTLSVITLNVFLLGVAAPLVSICKTDILFIENSFTFLDKSYKTFYIILMVKFYIIDREVGQIFQIFALNF